MLNTPKAFIDKCVNYDIKEFDKNRLSLLENYLKEK